jgi:lipoyl-dependent peroxiredoxin
MTKTIQVAEIISQGGRAGKVESADGGFAVQFTAPSDNAEGVTPEHLFAAAYAACFHGALLHAAERGHFKLIGSTIVGRVALGENERGEYGLKVELRAALPGIAEHDALHLMHQAHSTCPYSKAVRGNIEVLLTTD